MSWFSDIFSGGVQGLMDGAKGIISQFHLSPEDKKKFELEMEALVQKRMSELENTARMELQAKERVLVAELQQGDKFTKRARPMVVYAGLIFIIWNYCVVPIWHKVAFPLPTEFWVAWGGIVGTWAIGRSAEKIKSGGLIGKAANVITGGTSSLLQ